jgi:hypothetical protein
LANRQARLKDYAERRRVLLSLPINLSYLRDPSDEHPYRMAPDEVGIVSDVWRWHEHRRFELQHLGLDDGQIGDVSLLDVREAKGDETLLFSLEGQIWYVVSVPL